MGSALTPFAEHGTASVYLAHWRDLAAHVAAAGGCSTMIVDAPYSERTHAANDGGDERAQTAMLVAGGTRRVLDYQHWTPDDVREFVSTWSPAVSDWIVSITDHVLAPTWEAAFSDVGRCPFSPLAFTAPGSRVRLAGDGPSQWSTWIVVARPRTQTMARWGTLPGAYILPPGYSERLDVVGGKPLWIMERLVEDYSRPGDLIVDPCCGAGTTLVAAQRTGRRSIGGDILPAHVEIAARRIKRPAQQPLFAVGGGR